MQCGTCVTGLCLSDSATSCPATEGGAATGGGAGNGGGVSCVTEPGQSLEPCIDLCKPTEYGVMTWNPYAGAVTSSDAGPAYVTPNVPSGCRGVGASPETAALCCPCE